MYKKITFLFFLIPAFLFSQVTTNSAGAALTTSTPVDVNKEDWTIPSTTVCQSVDDRFARLEFTAGAISESELLESTTFTLADFPDNHPISDAKLVVSIRNFGVVSLLTNYVINIYRTEASVTTNIFSKTGSTTIAALDILDETFADQSDWNYAGLVGGNIDASTFSVEIVFSYTAGVVINTGIERIAMEFTTDSSLLPVTWNSFSGVQENNNVKLNWSTGTEVNVSHFEIEHSSNGEDWKTSGQQAAVGNSTIIQDYSFIHKFATPGVNYYRIKETDFDNTTNYSQIVTVRYNPRKQTPKFWISPLNENQLTLHSNDLNDDKFDIVLADRNGQLVQKWPQKMLESGGTQLDTPQLRSGVYYLILTDSIEGEVETVSFVHY